MSIRRILVRAPNWIGDAVMAIPALQQLRSEHPDAEITILARPWVSGLYRRESFCDELLPYTATPGWSGFADKWALSRTLHLRHFDCALLLQNAFEAAALVRLAGIPNRVGYNRDGRGWLLTHPIPVPQKNELPAHQRFYYLELLKRARLILSYPDDGAIRLEGAAEAASAGREHLRQSGLTGPVIGVSPGAAYGGAKRWLPERFAESAIQLARQLGAAVAVFGSAAEAAICQQVQGSVAASGIETVDFSSGTPLDQFIELAAACTVLLTNDSGPMHIASALGVPTVAVFGATDHSATGPTGPHSLVIRHPVECSPCLLRECPIDHRCMTGVSASHVAEQALVLLRAIPSNQAVN